MVLYVQALFVPFETCRLPKGIILFATRVVWLDWYEAFRRHDHESARESAIYDKLKKGPVFKKAINNIIPRESLVKEIRQFITPTEESRLYALIIGEHGTGKTSLIKLAVDGMDEPKGVVYVDADINGDSEVHIAEAM
jgi:polynucleotide 5'-kinase involved in rRNA processing